jgi:hypothetical protein
MSLDYEDIKKLLAAWNVTIVPREEVRVRGFELDIYRELAKQTEDVDYDCNFKDGCCRDRGPGDKNCCSECACTFGYWRKEAGALDEATVRIMAEVYDPRRGFKREDCGCLLPRELRSPICLYVLCSDAKLTGGDRYLLDKIHFGLSLV